VLAYTLLEELPTRTVSEVLSLAEYVSEPKESLENKLAALNAQLQQKHADRESLISKASRLKMEQESYQRQAELAGEAKDSVREKVSKLGSECDSLAQQIAGIESQLKALD
jgi:uncharacterized coiled-coil DUF342 family protein